MELGLGPLDFTRRWCRSLSIFSSETAASRTVTTALGGIASSLTSSLGAVYGQAAPWHFLLARFRNMQGHRSLQIQRQECVLGLHASLEIHQLVNKSEIDQREFSEQF
jgi:hypothetical protein